MTLSYNHICDVRNTYGAKLSTMNISSIYHTISQRGSEGLESQCTTSMLLCNTSLVQAILAHVHIIY